ncbi:hypothetical protein [Halorubrum aethiopicum]|nr:hypothetical protein [Halorubrum aethiopicum]
MSDETSEDPTDDEDEEERKRPTIETKEALADHSAVDNSDDSESDDE